MSRARLHVLHHEGAWAVRKGAEYYGPFPTQQAAVAHAACAACHASDYDVTAQIVVHAGRGRHRVERPALGARVRRLAETFAALPADLVRAARALLHPLFGGARVGSSRG